MKMGVEKNVQNINMNAITQLKQQQGHVHIFFPHHIYEHNVR